MTNLKHFNPKHISELPFSIPKAVLLDKADIAPTPSIKSPTTKTKPLENKESIELNINWLLVASSLIGIVILIFIILFFVQRRNKRNAALIKKQYELQATVEKVVTSGDNEKEFIRPMYHKHVRYPE